MKKFMLLFAVLFWGAIAYAEEKPFNTRIVNSEYDVFIQMNLYEETIEIPGQAVLGKVYGYLKKNTDSRVWIIMSVEFCKDCKKATVEMINDYGSEELVAELFYNKDGTYTLKQMEGSTIKIAGNGKWIKLPKTMLFKK